MGGILIMACFLRHKEREAGERKEWHKCMDVRQKAEQVCGNGITVPTTLTRSP